MIEIVPKHTRFRAYQLKTKGSSFSYWNGSYFILGEARYNDDNKRSLLHEMRVCNKQTLDVLHITSWDADHCSYADLQAILSELKPRVIEYPGYNIDNGIQNQADCLNLILKYMAGDPNVPKSIQCIKINNEYLSKLSPGSEWGYQNIIYNNDKNHPESNNNSTIKFFRSGSFTVLSLGDLEKEEISNWLIQHRAIIGEVDVLIMAHHGSDNGFTSSAFLDAVKPKIAISLSNWDNQHGNPDQAILRKLADRDIYYCSTKQGDLIIESAGDHSIKFKVWDYIADGEKLKDHPVEYHSKRHFKATGKQAA